MPEPFERRMGVLEARYANQFQVGHNEYEFVFDFGQLHSSEVNEGADSPVPIVRIVMGPPFAKALLSTLKRAVAEYERQHGTISEG